MRSLPVLLVFLIGVSCATAKNRDEIKELPGLNFALNYRQYSGYLTASRGKYLHYWFVESQSSPSTDPLLLWLNGGPGCSSMEGLLAELGPLHVKPDGKTLYNNTYAWNRAANVIFLETPAGVGYSYSDSQNYTSSDDTVSSDNYLALQHFFRKFPRFKKNDFYITGESYGGVYIPTLSMRVLKGPAKIKFKGFAIGNGYLDVQNLTNSIVFFAYFHGLVGVELWRNLTKYCCGGGSATQDTCQFMHTFEMKCTAAVQVVLQTVYGCGVNLYNLYADCAASHQKFTSYTVNKLNLMSAFIFLEEKNLHDLIADPPCTDSSNLDTYLNQKSVRSALHIPPHVPEWDICSTMVSSEYTQKYHTMRPQILQLLDAGLRGLIYNGDVDMACNFLGDEWFSASLGLRVKTEYSPWLFNGQVAGFVKHYDKNFTFLTIKGSGHMVPQDKPGPAYKMITSFLNNMPY